MTNDAEAIKREITAYCSQRPEVVACYLFGSYARGRQRDGSDVDVAFLLNVSVQPARYFDLKLEFCNELGGLLRSDIDPVIMNDAGEVLLEQIFMKGTLLFVRDRLEHSRFRATRLAMIADFLPHRLRQEDTLFRKYKEGRKDGR